MKNYTAKQFLSKQGTQFSWPNIKAQCIRLNLSAVKAEKLLTRAGLRSPPHKAAVSTRDA